MKKYQLGSNSDQLQNALQSTETPPLDSINVSFEEQSPDVYQDSPEKALVQPETADPVSMEDPVSDEETRKFVERMSTITDAMSSLDVRPEMIKAPGGFGESKYDKYANTQEDLDNLNEIRARHQSSVDIIGNLAGKLVGGIAINTLGSISMLAYGVPKGIYSGITGKEIDPETGFETGAGQRFLDEFTRNDLVSWLDEKQEDLQENLPIYYTQAEQQKSLMGSPLKFWADNIVNGFSFLTSAALTEAIFAAAGGASGTALGLETGPGAIGTGLGGAVAGSVAGLTRIRKLYRMMGSPFSTSSRLARNLTNASTLANEASATKRIMQGAWDAGTIGRQLVTGASYESALEMRMTHDEMLQTILDDKYGNRIAAKEKELGRELETLEKLQLLNSEERLAVDEIVTSTANSVFGANMVLVGLSNMFMLGHRFQPRLVDRAMRSEYNPANLIQKGFDKGLEAARFGEKGVKRTNAVLKWAGKGAYEGLIEEGGQGVLNRAAVDYATLTALGDTGLVESLGSYNNSLARGLDDVMYTKEGRAEVATGFLIGLVGLPRFIGGAGVLMSPELREEGSRIERLKNFEKYENDILETVKKVREENPGILHETAMSLAAMSLINARSEAYQAALTSGNKKIAKDIEVSNLIDYVLYKYDTGRSEEVNEMAKTISNMPVEEFKKVFGYEESMTDEDVLSRKAEVVKNTTDAVERIRKAAKKVDEVVGFNTDEKYNEVLKPGSIGNIRRNMIHYTANIAFSDQREKEMIARLADLTGGRITEVNDQVDSITFDLPDGSFKTIRVGELNIGSTVAQQKAETRKRVREIMDTDTMSEEQKRSEISDLEDYLNFLEELPENDMLMPNMFEMGPEEGSQLEEQIAEWMSSDPESSLKEDELYNLMDDIRKLRSERIKFGEILRMLKDPRKRSVFYQEVEEKVKEHKKASKESQDQKKKSDPEVKKKTKADEAKEKRNAFRQKLRSFRSKLQEELKEANDRASKVSEDLRYYSEELSTLKKLEKRARKNKNGLAGTSSYRDGIKMTVDEIKEKVEEVKKFLAEAREEEARLQESLPERKREIEITLEALQELESSEFDPVKYDPTLTDVHNAVKTYAQMKGVSEMEAGVLVKQEAEQETSELDAEITAFSSKLDEIEGLAAIVQSIADTLENIPEEVLMKLTDNGFVREILKKYPDVKIENIPAILQDLRNRLKDLRGQKDAAISRSEIGKDVARSTVFKQVLEHEVTKKPKETPDYDMFQQEPRMYQVKNEKDNFKQDISEGINKTAGLQGSYSIELGQVETGAVDTFNRLTKKSMTEKLNEVEKTELKNAESQLVFFNALNNMTFPNEDGILRSFGNKKNRTVYGKALVFIHSGMKLPKELSELKGMFKDDPEKGSDGKDIKAVLATIDKNKKTGEWETRFERYQGRLIYTSLFLPQLESNKGYERFTNKKNLSEEEKDLKVQELRNFRKSILDQDRTFQASQIIGKAQGSVLMMREKEIAENGGRLNFADEAVIAPKVLSDVGGKKMAFYQSEKDTLILVSKEIQNEDGGYALGEVGPGQHMKWKKGMPSIMLPPGKAMAYDHMSHVNVPMTPTQLSSYRAKNLARLYTFALKRHKMLMEAGDSATTASSKVFSTPLTFAGETRSLSSFIMDQVNATSSSKDGFNLHLELDGQRFSLLYGENDRLYAEDMDDPASVNDLVEFLQTKYHNVNANTLGTPGNESATLEQANKKENGKTVYSKRFVAKEGRKWVDYVISDEIMDEEGNIKISGGTVYFNYNEYLLKRRKADPKDPEAETLAPLMTKARSIVGSRLMLDQGPEVAMATASNSRTEGGNLRFSYSLAPVEKIVSTKNQKNTDQTTSVQENDYSQEPQKENNDDFENSKDLDDALEDSKKIEKIESKTIEKIEKKEESLIEAGTHVWIEEDGIKYLVPIEEAGEKERPIEPEDESFEDEDDTEFMLKSLENAKDINRKLTEKKRASEIENALRMTSMDVAISQSLLNSLDGPAVAALTEYGKVVLSTLAPSGAIYHEAFHNISLYLLSPKDSEILYRRVKQMPGETVTYKGKKKEMSKLTDKEAEEWLAEEFREYVLSDGNYEIGSGSVKDTRSILKKFFDAVSSLVRRLLRLNESFEYDPKIKSIEGLFADIESGKFLGVRKRTDRGRSGKANMLMKLPGFDQKTSNAIMDGISAHLGDLFEKPFTFAGKEYEALEFYDLYSPASREGKIDAFYAIYFKALAEFRRELQGVIRSEDATEAQKNAAVQIQDHFRSSENRKLALRMHLNRMEVLGFSVQEDVEKDENDVVSKDWVDDMDALQISASKSAPAILKLMLSTIRDDSETTVIGTKGTYQLGKLLPKLQNLLTGTMSFSEQMAKLNSVRDKDGFEWAGKVMDMFNRELSGLSYEQGLPVLRFRTHMAQSSIGAEYSKMTQSGEIYTIDPAKENVYNTIRRNWLTELRLLASSAPYLKQDGARVVFDLDSEFEYRYAGGGSTTIKFEGLRRVIDDMKRNEDPAPELLNILKLLGVRFSNENVVIEKLENEDSEYGVNELKSDIKNILGDITQRGTDSTVNIFEREFSSAVSRMNRIIRLEEETGERDVELMFLNSEGNMESSVVRYHYMSTIASLSYEEIQEYYEPKEYPFGINSMALDAWREGKKVEVKNISGLAAEVIGETGNKITSLNETDLNVLFMHSILNDTFINMRTADQSTEFGVKFPFKVPDNFDAATEIALKYIYSEMAASAKNIDDLKYVKGYSENIQELRMMKAFVSPEMNSKIRSKLADPVFRKNVMDQIRSTDDGTSHILQKFIDDNSEKIKDSVRDRFGKDLISYKDYLVASKNLSELDGSGFRYFYGIDAKMLSERGEISQLVPEVEVNRILEKVLAKHFIAKNELYRMFYNDPAFYSDFKRFKGLVGTKALMTNERSILEWLNSDGNLSPKVVEEGKVDVLHVQEPVFKVEDELLELYRETYGEDSPVYIEYSKSIKYADGLILIDLPFARLIGATSSQWSPAQERTYHALMNQEDPSEYLSIEDGGTITQAKTHYFGPSKTYKDDGSKANGMAFLKMSMSPVYRQLAYMNGKKYPNILAMLEFMKKNKAHAIVLPSAIKVGGPNELAQTNFLVPEQQYDVLEGKEKTIYRMQFPDKLMVNASKMELDLRFMGTQLEISPFFKGKTTTTVQATVHTLANLYDSGIPRFGSDVEEKVLDYHRTRKALVEKAFEEMLVDYGIERTVLNGRKGYSLSQQSYQKILKKLEEEVTSMQAGMGLLGGIQYLKEKGGEYKLDYFVDKHRIETMLYSAIGKQIIRQKMPGEMAVQDSMLGFEVSEVDGKLEDSSFRFYQKEGKWTAQVMLPHWFKEFYTGENEVRISSNGDLYVDGEKFSVDKELLEVIGIRVPTDGTHSIEVLEIAGFLPKHMGARIVVPPGIVTKAGSDFDIDKLTLYYMNYMKNGDRLNSIPFYYDPEEWFNSEKQHVETLISRIKESQNLLSNLLDVNEKYSVFEDVMTDLMSTLNSSWVKEQLSEEDVNALFEDVKGDVYGVSENSTYDQKIEALEEFYSKKESEVIVREGDPRLNAIEGVSLPMTYRSYVDQGRFDDLLRSVEEKIEVLSRKLEKRFTTEYSFEEWIKMNPDPDMFALQSKKALQNEYIRLKKQLLSLQSRELRETFLKPVGTPNLDDLAKRIEGFFNKKGRSATPPANLKEVTDYHLTTLPENLSKVTYSYMQSKKDVGIFALASTHTVKAQKAGVMFDMNTEYDIPVKKGRPGRTALSGIHFDYSKFKKEQDGSGRYYDGMISMSSVMNETKEIITEIISEMVNAAVDGVNNPILHILNIPPALAPAAVSLVRMGVPMTDTIYFMNQPIVRDFIEAKEISKGAMVKALSDLYSNFKMYDADIISEMEGKYAVGETVEKTGPTYFTPKMLEDMIGKLPEEMTPEQRSHQLQILTDLIVYMNIGDDMTAAINAQSFDTKLPKSRAEMRLTMAMYDEILSRGVFPNVEKITEDDDVYLKAMKDYNDVADDVLEELFIAEDGTLPFKEVFKRYMKGEGVNLQNDFKLGYAKLLGSLSHPNNRMSKDKKVRVLERFEQFHIASLVQNVIGPIGKISDSAERLMFGNEKGISMAQTLEKIQTDTKHPLHGNRFMNAFLPVIQDDRNDPTKNDHIEPRFKAMNMYEDAAIVDDFEAIRAYDAQNNTSYASDLWKTAVLQAGMMNTPFSFLERLSGEMTADIMSGMYDSYRETEAQLRDPNNANLPSGYLLLRMFAENMVNDPDIVPFVSKDRNGDPSPSERMESYALFVKTYSAGTSAQIKRSVGESKTQKEYDLYMAIDSSTMYDVHGKKKKISYEPLNGRLLSSRTYLQAFAGSVKKSDRTITKKKDC